MDIDSLTIGQARELARLFSAHSAAPSVTIGADRVGKVCLIRSRGSGVWIGTMVSRSIHAAGVSVELSDARRLWYWEGAGECSTLALTGPTDGKIGPACSPIVHEVVEEHVCAPAAIAALARVPVWTK
jgi:hypothetical protein